MTPSLLVDFGRSDSQTGLGSKERNTLGPSKKRRNNKRTVRKSTFSFSGPTYSMKVRKDVKCRYRVVCPAWVEGIGQGPVLSENYVQLRVIVFT